METDTAARAAVLPGVDLRPYRGEGDLPEVVRVQNAAMAADGTRQRASVEGLRAWWGTASEHFDPARDVDMAEIDGRVVAVAQRDWIDATDGVREYRSRCWLDPAHRHRGIGTQLLTRNEAAGLAMARAHGSPGLRAHGLGTAEANAGAVALADAFGYRPVRWFADMERSLRGALPDVPPMPTGLEVRPVTADHARRVWEADLEAFRDHWGGWDTSEASFARWIESPEFQPELMVVAWDGDEIAGAVLNVIDREENAALGVERGGLDSVFTRRAWRKRGLARALIVRSLHLLRSRGLDVAVLGVDADNPNGAFALYESAGFEARERFVAWRKPMESVE